MYYRLLFAGSKKNPQQKPKRSHCILLTYTKDLEPKILPKYGCTDGTLEEAAGGGACASSR